MHIPDGYLSPSTCAVLGAAMVPVWAVSVRRVKQLARSRSAPLLAVGAAYCFLVMMFNVPIPDGTTAHAVGGVLIAILLGRWAAVIAVSVALGLQALFFGDGGVLAFGANCFNMAFVLPFVGYGAYLLLSRGSSLTDRRRVLAAGAGAYIGLNAAALCAAVEFGLQPDLFHTANGTPLYAPFHLSQTIPAMAIAHLTVAGFVEFTLTAGVVAYLQRAQLPSAPDQPSGRAGYRRAGRGRAWLALGVLRPDRDDGALPARAARSGGRVRRGLAGESQPRRVPPLRRPAGPQRLRRVLEPHGARRLRLLRRLARVPRLRALGLHRRARRGRRRSG